MANNPDISIVIPTYRRETVLLNTINALFKQSHDNFELLVIDQTAHHSSDFKKNLAAIKDRRLHYYLVKPASVTAAKNFALSVAQAPIVLILDDDIIPTQDLVKYHLKAYREHRDLSAVAGRVMQAGFPVQENVLKFDDYAISQGVFTATKPAYTNAFPGGNCSLLVEAAEQVGGFDTRYYRNGFREESDMSNKLDRAGLKIFYEPRAEVLHLAEPSGGSRSKSYKDLYDSPMFYRNELFFTLRSAKAGKRIEALRRKYRIYCLGVRHWPAYRRRLLFWLGLLAALWRQAFGHQTVAREVVQ